MYDNWDRFSPERQAATRGSAAAFLETLPGAARGWAVASVLLGRRRCPRYPPDADRLPQLRRPPTSRSRPGAIVVTGDNGAGQDQPARGGVAAVARARPARRRAVRRGAQRRAGRLDGGGRNRGPGGAVAIGTGACRRARPAARADQRRDRAAASALGEWLSVLWLTPAMDRLFLETASARRRFLDRLVLALDPGHAGEAARYDAAMRARNPAADRRGGAPIRPGWPRSSARWPSMARASPRRGRRRSRRSAMRSPPRPPADFPRAAVALEGGACPRPCARSPRSRGRRCRRRARHRRAAPRRPARHPCRQAPAGGAQLDRRAEGAAPRHRPRPRRAGRRRAPGGRRCCSSTRSPPISTPAAALRCSRGWPGDGQVWMTGTEASLFAGLDAQRLHVESGRVG